MHLKRSLMGRSALSSAKLPLSQKISELASFFAIRTKDAWNQDLSYIFRDLEEYGALLSKYSDISINEAKVLEIGFGARPNRMIALASLGVDVVGVDTDMPMLFGTPKELYNIYRRNGAERAIKSFIRFMFFDILERRCLRKEIESRGGVITVPQDRFLVGDAADLQVEDASLHLIYSEDVFEHIPLPSLRRLVAQMGRWLPPNGLALIRPNIYTGITGGHLAEWFPCVSNFSTKRRKSEPWEHLRKQRWKANTHLNKLNRAEYRKLFGERFQILEERTKCPDLGKEFYTGSIRDELRSYPEHELFSNAVLFVLRPKTDVQLNGT